MNACPFREVRHKLNEFRANLIDANDYQLWKVRSVAEFRRNLGDISNLLLQALREPVEIVDDKSAGDLIVDDSFDA